MNKSRIASAALAASLFGTAVTGAVAAQRTSQQGGAAGLVAAVVQVSDAIDINDSVVQVGLVNVNESLNNLRALNNVLNNSPILSNNDIDVTITDVNVLNGLQITALNNFLNGSNIVITDVVAVGVLSGGDLIVFA